MNWFDILKQYNVEHNLAKLKELEGQFSNSEKAIGYLPILWSVGIEDKIKDTAVSLGLEYHVFPSRGKTSAGNGNSFGNGGHFMWNAGKVQSILSETDFRTVNDLIDFVATQSYLQKPYRRLIDNLFGTPEVTLNVERRENNFKGSQRGFE